MGPLAPREIRRACAAASPCGCRSLLRDRHRDALAAFSSAAAQHLAPAPRLLARAESVRAFSALVVWLIRTLHGMSPAMAERDRYSRQTCESRRHPGVHFASVL